MMTKRLIILLFLLQGISFSQALDSTGSRWMNMLPLNVGDFRIYGTDCSMCSSGAGYRESIIGDTILADGNKYFITHIVEFNERNQWNFRNGFLRVDSLGNVWKGLDTDDINFITRLNVAVGDTIWNHPDKREFVKQIVTSITDSDDGLVIEYQTYIFFQDFWQEFIGYTGGGGEGYWTSFRGAFIGGKVYNDTTFFLPISDSKNMDQTLFMLHQNFPNPFNPKTTISFYLPTTTKVNLDIFNVKGIHIKSLFKGQLAVGLHKIEFDGTDLSSGIYFYKLDSEIGSLVKKMVLVK